MKKLFLSAFILTSSIAFCQTTDDEYNYLTKGYAVQVSSGLDMKQGYSMTDKGTNQYDGGLPVSVKYLYRTNGNVYAGALLTVTGVKGPKGSNINPTQYFCVPAPGSSAGLWNNTISAIRAAFGNDIAGYESVMWALMHILP